MEKRNIILENLIHEFVMQTNGTGMKTIRDLIERIEADFPDYMEMVNRAISEVNFSLVVNRSNDTPEMHQIVKRIQDVSYRMLAIHVGHVGTIGYHHEIETSARELCPAVAKNPHGEVAREIELIMKALVCGKA